VICEQPRVSLYHSAENFVVLCSYPEIQLWPDSLRGTCLTSRGLGSKLRGTGGLKLTPRDWGEASKAETNPLPVNQLI
jgi:hypothetical protein